MRCAYVVSVARARSLARRRSFCGRLCFARLRIVATSALLCRVGAAGPLVVPGLALLLSFADAIDFAWISLRQLSRVSGSSAQCFSGEHALECDAQTLAGAS